VKILKLKYLKNIKRKIIMGENIERRKTRIKIRLEKHNYRIGKRTLWNYQDIRNFIINNQAFTDVELAKHLNRSIPAIQYMRRKYNGAKRKLKEGEATIDKLVQMIQLPEKYLIKGDVNEK